MKFIICSIALIFNFVVTLNLQAQNTDPYNLSFDGNESNMIGFNDNWQFLKSIYFRINSDTICKINGKSSLSLSLDERTDFNNGYGFFYQKLPIPSYTKKLELSCWSRGVQLNNTYLYCHITNSDNQIIGVDSVKLPNSINWKKSKLKLQLPSLKNKRILYISFNSYNHSVGWVDNLEIRLDGIPYYQKMNSQEFSQPNSMSFIENADSLSDQNMDLKYLHTPSVIGIGESSHGSHEQLILRNKLIKHLVENENAKLIIFEFDESFAATMNKYINNEVIDTNFNLEDYFKDLPNRNHIYQNQETIDLIKFLRQYNDKHNDKVNFTGMDYSFGGDEWISFQMSYDGDKGRDKYMATQALKHIENFCKEGRKTIIWGHLGHIMHESGDITYFKTNNTGKWLSDKLGKNYYVIGLFTGKGSVLVNPIFEPTVLNLVTPIPYSLEESCMLTNQNTLYFNTSTQSKLDSITSFRFTGTGIERRQFHSFIKVKKLFDAVAYIKESKITDFILLTKKPIPADTLIYNKVHYKRATQKSTNIKISYSPLSVNKIKDGIYLNDNDKNGIAWKSTANDTIYLKNQPYIDIDNLLLFDFFVSEGKYNMYIYFNQTAKELYNDIEFSSMIGLVIGGKLIFNNRKFTVKSNLLPSSIILSNLSISDIQLIEKKYPKKTYWSNKPK